MAYRTHYAKTAAIAVMMGLAFATAASRAATEDEQESACRGDAFHFCSSEIPNKEKITACMKQHYAELSPPCKAMFGKKPKGQSVERDRTAS